MNPIRPTYRDISVRWAEQFPSEWLKWGIDGHVLNQVERDAREMLLAGIVLPEAIRFARSLRALESEVRYSVGQLTTIFKLETNYEAREMAGGGGWTTIADGRKYGKDHAILRKIGEACTSGAKAYEAAASSLLSANLLDALDLRIETDSKGKRFCKKGALFLLPTKDKLQKFESGLAAKGAIQTKKPMPALTSEQKHLLEAVHLAHGGGGGSTQLAHFEFEKSARNDEELHFFQIKPFSGFNDGWPATQWEKIHTLQHKFHTKWSDSILTGSWEMTRRADTDHHLSHIMGNLRAYADGKPFEYEIIFSRDDIRSVGAWPMLTPMEHLATL